MDAQKQSPKRELGATFKTNLRPQYKPAFKKYPAYSRQLMGLRLAGKMPAGRVIVSFDWNLGRAYTRIVVPLDVSPADLSFVYLAGLSVQIVYHAEHAHLINGLVEAILKVNPSCLTSFAMDLVGTGEALTVIKPYELNRIAEAA